jgi:hypothetical protein
MVQDKVTSEGNDNIVSILDYVDENLSEKESSDSNEESDHKSST